MAELDAQIKPLEDKLKKPLSFAALGLSTREAAAVFFVDDHEPILVVPLADRSRFVAVSAGTRDGDVDRIEKDLTCTMVKNVYACAKNLALIARLGKGRVPEPRIAVRTDGRAAGSSDHRGRQVREVVALRC